MWYTIHMRRTNLVLNGELLDQAVRALGAKTYSAAVNTALEEVLRVRKLQGLHSLFGRGLWEGNLSEMREDRPGPRKARAAKAR